MECLFCKIASGALPSYCLKESSLTKAFLDIHPLAPGHAVVIPKMHAERIINLPAEQAGDLFLTVKQVSDIIHASLKPDGFTIGINDGSGGHQGVPHLHMHIIPRWNGDGEGNLHSLVHNAPRESIETIFKKLIS